jgi:hypothetical protein
MSTLFSPEPRMVSLICRAIQHRSILQANYHGKVRVFEPHCHGYSPHGDEVVLAYQRHESSLSDAPAGWRCFHVVELHDLVTLEMTFKADHVDYRPRNDVLAHLHCSV